MNVQLIVRFKKIFIFFYLDEANENKLCVKPKYKIVKLFDDYKGWDDGTFAISCE